MSRGGARPNSGPKKGSKHKKTIEKEKALEYIKKRVVKELKSLIDAKLELAKGIYIMKPVKVGDKVVNVKVFKEKPDSNSIEDLLNRAIGKVKETMDIDLKSEDIKQLSESIKQLANEKEKTI